MEGYEDMEEKRNKKCECYVDQGADHIFKCKQLPFNWGKIEFMIRYDISDKMIQITTYWEGKNIKSWEPIIKEEEEVVVLYYKNIINTEILKYQNYIFFQELQFLEEKNW